MFAAVAEGRRMHVVQRCAALLGALAAAALLASCVERKMVIRSDPQGAMISLDGEDTELRTPAEIPFDFGGTRAVTLIAPGHRVKETTAELEDPWFTYFPLDVVAEFAWPGTIEDVQVFDYTLEPYAADISVAEQSRLRQKLAELKLRAEEYRAGGSEGPGHPERRETPAK
jgi:PEGA domain-containing protein